MIFIERKPFVLLVVRDNQSYIQFAYQGDFVGKIVSEKKRLNLTWKKELLRWEFNTLNLDSITQFLLDDKIEFKKDDRRKNTDIKKPFVLVVIKEKFSYMNFEYDRTFATYLSNRKADLKIFWKAEKKRWEFATENVENILDDIHENTLLGSVKTAFDIQVIIDDRRA